MEYAPEAKIVSGGRVLAASHLTFAILPPGDKRKARFTPPHLTQGFTPHGVHQRISHCQGQ
ncbi:hypothetical protein PC116_g13263 [Phytophthora cactorum]|nr:hypothetical protein PC120_g8920 [Phytophthora cactorum]KAG3188447.1 hypothetical protein PC128_g12176 [Phytophthora cactorum]KAG4238703.1 hypothetical protein PC116_g13263 [Phytophthora cactorum]